MPNDPDEKKGAVEQDRPEQPTNTTLSGQNPHRHKGQTLQGQDTDLPEPGENEEHSMEEGSVAKRNPEGVLNDQDPGHRQKQNQNDRREDPLAS
jgi:hypothetical protein